MPMAKRLRPVPIPKGVTVEKSADGSTIAVKGPLGRLEIKVNPRALVEIKDNTITVYEKQPESLVFVGTTRALILNMIKGVTQGFEKVLEIRGTGYRAQKTKDGIQVFVGFIHPVDFPIPKGITVELKQVPNPDDTKVQMTELVIKGCDKQLVGEIAAKLRDIKHPDVYKGKGIRYKGEYVRKKAGKRAVATQT
jgi:large subunit ribosomal protein L6